MADLLPLPVTLSADASRRLGAQLEIDARAGVDLGPRHVQIACLTASLSHALQDLMDAIGWAAADLPADDPALTRLRANAFAVSWLALVMMASAAELRAHAAPD